MTDTGTLHTRDDRAVREVPHALVAARAANDAKAFADHYADDATVVLPGGVFHQGRAEVRRYMTAAFAGPLRGSTSVDEPESVRVVDGDTAVVVSRSGLLLPGGETLPADRLRRATWVLSRRGDAWRVAGCHNCPA
ncbi:SgcJ/EcaC family oxidoreductase [Micromonospora sp. RTP1Z1]|uniref:SgcJ/EcaC family oxidoreductase n=1 Tax=Micromonospora sp. RTP1Z1 TaxID=2994043 RepID=UPI0029C98084|nr:SgcJ/EcaC family oxidoreductase [Micromonospora sp. RTP1Z1]